jgi:hypothetical protein
LIPSRILFELAGCPYQDGCFLKEFTCWLCGESSSNGMLISNWKGANFVDQNKSKCYSSDMICECCIWTCSWVPPPGYDTSKVEKRGPNLRLFTHLWSDNYGYEFYTKKDKYLIFKWLCKKNKGDWFCAISDSGKKHILPWTPFNFSESIGSVIRFETDNIILKDFWIDLVNDNSELLNVRITKNEILNCDYTYKSYLLNSELIFKYEKKWSNIRNSNLFKVCLWLSTKGG